MAGLSPDLPTRRGLLLGGAALGLAATAPFGLGARASEGLQILCTIAQIGQPLQRIAGEHARVDWLLGEGVDPHSYRLTRRDVARLTGADMIFYNGLYLEAQMVEMMEALGERKPVLAVAEAARADEDGSLLPWDVGPGDPHLWMDPALWRRAIAAAVATMSVADSTKRDAFAAGYEAFASDVQALESYAEEALATIPEQARILVTAHDAFGYFGRRFALQVEGIQGISTESEAGLKRIEDLVDLLVTRKVPAVFVETSVSERNVRALIDGAAARGHDVRIGGTLFSDAMGAPGTYQGTYLGMIDHNVTTITRALGGQAPEAGYFGRLG